MPFVEESILVGVKEGQSSAGLKEELAWLREGKANLQVNISGNAVSEFRGLVQEAKTGFSVKAILDRSAFDREYQKLRSDLSGVNINVTANVSGLAEVQRMRAELEAVRSVMRDISGMKLAPFAPPSSGSPSSPSTPNPTTQARRLANSAYQRGINPGTIPTHNQEVADLLREAAGQPIPASLEASGLIRNERSARRVVAGFNTRSFAGEIWPTLTGNDSARRAVRAREAMRIAEENDHLPGIEDRLLSQANSGRLPGLFNSSWIKDHSARQAVMLGSLQNGGLSTILGAAGSAAGAAFGGGAPAALAVGETVRIASSLADAFLRPLKERENEVKEAGLQWSGALQSVTAALQESTKVIREGGGPAPTPGESYKYQQRQAREIAGQFRGQLLPLGISGESESALTSVATNTLTNRFGSAPPAQSAELTGLVASFALANNIPINERLTSREFPDVLLNQRMSQNMLGMRMSAQQRQVFASNNFDEVLARARKEFGPYRDAFMQSDEPAAVQRRLEGAQGQATMIAGDVFTRTLSPSQQFQERVAKNRDVIQAQERLGKAGGLFSGLGNYISGGAQLIGSRILNTDINAAKYGVLEGALRDVPGAQFAEALLSNSPGRAPQKAPLKSVQNDSSKLNTLINAAGFNDLETKFSDKASDRTQLRRTEGILSALRGTEDESSKAPAFLSESTGQMGKLGQEKLSTFASSTFAGQQQRNESERGTVGQELAAMKDYIGGLQKAQASATDPAKAKEWGDRIVDAQEKVLSLKAKEVDLAQKQYSQSLSQAEKLSHFGNTVEGLSQFGPQATKLFGQAISSAQSPEDRLSAMLAQSNLRAKSGEAIGFGEQLRGQEDITFAGKERRSSLEFSQAQAEKAGIESELGRLRSDAGKLRPGTSEFRLNAIAQEEQRTNLGAASAKETSAGFAKMMAPQETKIAADSLALALNESGRTIQREAHERDELTNKLQLAQASLENFGKRLDESKAGKELQIADLAKKIQGEGGTVFGEFSGVSDERMKQLQLFSDTRQFNRLTAEAGVSDRASGGFGLGAISESGNSEFALQQRGEKAGLQRNVFETQAAMQDLPAKFAKAGDELVKTIADLTFKLGGKAPGPSAVASVVGKAGASGNGGSGLPDNPLEAMPCT